MSCTVPHWHEHAVKRALLSTKAHIFYCFSPLNPLGAHWILETEPMYFAMHVSCCIGVSRIVRLQRSLTSVLESVLLENHCGEVGIFLRRILFGLTWSCKHALAILDQNWHFWNLDLSGLLTACTLTGRVWKAQRSLVLCNQTWVCCSALSCCSQNLSTY